MSYSQKPQGDIVGIEYIISSKFMPPYGILLTDSTIELSILYKPCKYYLSVFPDIYRTGCPGMPTRPVLESSRLDLSNSRSLADKAFKIYM
jgi:hypothetical protein